MTCPHCEATATTERVDRTKLGYRRFRCHDCSRVFHERTGTLFSRLQYPTEVVCLVVCWRFRYKLSRRDLEEERERQRRYREQQAEITREARRRLPSGFKTKNWHVQRLSSTHRIEIFAEERDLGRLQHAGTAQTPGERDAPSV
jgi:hypothetical protein